MTDEFYAFTGFRVEKKTIQADWEGEARSKKEKKEKKSRCRNIQSESKTDTKFMSRPLYSRQRRISAGRRLPLHQKALTSHTDLGIWPAEVASAAGGDAGQDFSGGQSGFVECWMKNLRIPTTCCFWQRCQGQKSQLDSLLSHRRKTMEGFWICSPTAVATELERRM